MVSRYSGVTLHRDHAGWGDRRYTNATGRNDIVRAKVARGANNVSFYVETEAPLTPRTGKDWMVLYLDADQNPHTGWHGYDYALNLGGVAAKTTTLKRNAGGWKWTTVADVPYRMAGNRLMVQVPRAAIGQTERDVALDFHWADNAGSAGDIARFFTDGDSAPNRRFNYRYGKSTPGPVWEFRTNGFANGWTAGPGVSDLRVEHGTLAGKITAGAHIQSDRYPSIEASANPYVVIRMRTGAGKRATLYWASAKDAKHTEDRKASFPVIADGQFHTYVVDMRKVPGWTGWVNTLRLHPTDAPGTFEIARIWVRPQRP